MLGKSGLLLLIQIVLLAIWTAVSPPVVGVNRPSKVEAYEICTSSNYAGQVMAIITGCYTGLLIFGVIALAYLNRNVCS